MILSSVRKSGSAIVVVLAILASLLIGVAPAKASNFSGTIFFRTKLAPGATISLQHNNWNPTSSTWQWFRCDSPVSGVEVTSTPITVPADCEALVGEVGSTYQLSGLNDGNPDEGKYFTALETSDANEYSLAPGTQNFVIMNRGGGNSASDGMRIIMGNGSLQVYRNSYNQIYDYGVNGPASSMPAVGAEGQLIVPTDVSHPELINIFYPNSNVTPQTTWDTTQTEVLTEDQVAGYYAAKTTFTKTFSNGHAYSLVETVTYQFPNQVADINFSVVVPDGATTPVSLYYGIDMYLDGNDFGPGKSFLMGPNRLVVQSNPTGVGGILEGSGPGFSSWVEAFYSCIFGHINVTPSAGDLCGPYGPAQYGAGAPEYPNTVDVHNTDSGIGAQWALGSAPGTYERNMKLYFSENRVQLSLNYSQDAARINNQVVTYLNVNNTAGSQVDNMEFDIVLPDATYGSPVSTCGGTATIDASLGTPHLQLTGGAMTIQTATCQLIIPTTFTSEGTFGVNATNMVSGTFHKDGDVENATPLSNMLGTSIVISANGPTSPNNTMAATASAASDIGQTSATLNGLGSIEGLPGYASFCYSTNANLSGCTNVNSAQGLVSGDPSTPVSAHISGLTAGTKYYFALTVSNGLTSTQSATLSFTTSNCYEELNGGNIGARDHVIRFTGDCHWAVPAGVTQVQVLVVAGGGGGGADCVGGGGGAGGVNYNASFDVSGTVTVSVGSGGSAGQFIGGCQGTQAGNGGNSSFGTLQDTGGGGGGNYLTFVDGAAGGSGGGGGGVIGHGGSGTTGQGFAGGDGNGTAGNPGGGGGGATAAGGVPGDGIGGAGGAGYSSEISGQTEIYSAGGGGASDLTGGPGGASCAGIGASGETPATNATGFGCGGGGGDGHNPGGTGSAGIVIIRWTDPLPPVASAAQKTFTGFEFEKSTLTTPTKRAIRAFLLAHPTLGKISCTGYTGYNWFHRPGSFLKKLALKRANAVCAYAKSLRPNLVIVKKTYVNTGSKLDSARKVLIRLTN